MSDPSELEAPQLGVPPSLLSPEAFVTIGPESADEVELASARGRADMQVRGITTSEIELFGAVFLPRTVHVRLELQIAGQDEPGQDEPSQGEVDQSPSFNSQLVSGTVRKVQLVSSEPGYKILVQLDAASAATLPPLVVENAGEATPIETSVVTASFDSLPEWASSLVREELVSSEQMESIAATAESDGVALENALINSATVLEEIVAIHMALSANAPYVDPRGYEVRLANSKEIPEPLAREHGIFPLFRMSDGLVVGMPDPSDLALIDLIRLRTGSQVEPCMCPPSTLSSLIDRAYSASGIESKSVRPGPRGVVPQLDTSSTSDNAIVKLVRAMVEDAARIGASDVHIEPERDRLRIRIRVDGILVEKSVHPLEQHALIVSRIKVLSKLDIADSRRPQDGNYSMQGEMGTIDVRVSTIPTVYGENVVLRLLKSDEGAADLEQLGMPPRVLDCFSGFLAQPNGMILVTGPTGSGKTTTLYAALSRVCSMETNVATIEDPVEKRLPLLRQTQVNAKAGITFATGLRSLLRQDPDVIMLGEIRDRETADIAVQAALTGHLVLSTLHTNTAAGAIVRLSEMKIPPFLITSSLQAVLSQRLARRICPSCAEEVEPDARIASHMLKDAEPIKFMAGAGCNLCFQTGYKGRVALYELLRVTPRLGDALLGEASRDTIESEAANALVGSMWDDGIAKVREGKTTLEEVVRIVGLPQDKIGRSGDS